MADYYVDIDGNVTTDAEQKKKKADYSVDADGNVTVNGGEGDWGKRTWFQGSKYFDDGYQFGDVTKTWFRTWDDIWANVGSGILEMGEKTIDGLATVAPLIAQGQYYQNGGGYSVAATQAFEQGISQLKKDTAEFVAKDLYDSEAIIRDIVGDTDKNSVLGEKSDALVQSAGQLLGTVAVDYMTGGVGGTLANAVMAFGGEAENAFKEGASYEDAALSSLISAASDVLTEKISGGIKFGKGGTLDDILTKKLATGISNKFFRTAAKLGLDMAGEGSEELVSGYLSDIGKKLTYMDEKEWSEMLSWSDERWEEFVGGAILGGGSGAIKAGISSAKGVDSVTGLNKSEQAVVDKVVKDLIAESENESGKKLTAKEKSEIKKDVLDDLEKGRISIDTIEEVLGGESYKAYNDVVKNEDSIKAEHDELNKMKRGEMTGEQIDRLAELKEQLKEIQKTSKRDELKTKLGDNVFSIAKDTRLAESYNQRAQSGRYFEADVTQYKGKARETVQAAIDSKIINNTRRSHELVDLIAKISEDKGITFDFTNNQKLKESGFSVEGATVNGYVQNGKVTINTGSQKYLNAVVGHEVMHVLEGSEFASELAAAAIEFAKAKGEYDSRYNAIVKAYAKVEGFDVNNADSVNTELVADLVGDYLFTDSKFLKSLSAEKPKLFQKIWNEVKYLAKTVLPGSKEGKQLVKLEKAFAEAYRDTKKAPESGEVRYSVGGDETQIDNGVSLDNGESPTITAENVQELRSIGRKSINAFTSEDIKKAEPWARKFYAELGTKSPFFRAWFGDWRVHDQSKIKTVTVENIDLADVVMQNGDYGNTDTGWTIHAGMTLRDETKHYARGEKVSFKALNDVKNILENAVLLDTEISVKDSNKKSPGTAFMHKLYAPILYKGKSYIAKINVEEYFDEGTSSVKRKGYHLTAIKIEAADGSYADFSTTAPRSDTASTEAVNRSLTDYSSATTPQVESASVDSIADLHGLVKIYDEKFSPKDVNPLLLNEDGTPKVFYHQTESDFSVFNTENESAGKYDSDLPTGIFFKSSNRDIGLKGKKQMPVYLHAVNPLTFVSREAAVSYWRKNVNGYTEMVDSVKEVDTKYKKLFDEESKREKEEYMRLWKERQAGSISEEEYQNAVSRDKLEEILDRWTSAADEVRRKAKELINSYIASSGYDGLIIQNDQGSFGRSTDAYIVFDSTQIKSATNNIGTFDGENPDIRYSVSADDAIAPPVKGDLKISGEDVSIAPPIGENVPRYRTEPRNKSTANESFNEVEYRKNADKYDQLAKEYDTLAEEYDRLKKESFDAYMPESTKRLKEIIQRMDEIERIQSALGIRNKGKNIRLPDMGGKQSSDLSFENNEVNEASGSLGELPIRGDFKISGEEVSIAPPIGENVPRYRTEPLTGDEIAPPREKTFEEKVAEAAEAVSKSKKENTASDDEIYRGDAPPTAESEPIKTVRQRVDAHIKALGTELENNKELREQSKAEYEAKINELRAKYDGKKDKTTKAANDILRSIERLKRLQSSNDANYEKRINDLEERIEKSKKPEYERALRRQEKQSEYSTWAEELIGDTSTWKDKAMGLSYKINTLRRNLRDVVRGADGKKDIAKADRIYDELQGKYNTHEAELKRESRRIKSPYADMKITAAEDAYIQMLGELRHNPDTELTAEKVTAFYEKHKNKIDKEKVDRAIEMARKTYDELLIRVNEVLREQGMKEIPYRQGYFPHFTNTKQNVLAKLFNWKTQNNEIPTDIAGMTEAFEPKRSWQSFNKERTGDSTDYSFTQGLDTYVHGALDWIYHIEDIQKRRAFENQIRYVHSEEGVKNRINEIRQNEEYDADHAQEQMDMVFAEAKNPLNNFVTDLRTGTNTLAGKKSTLDRSMESATNRKIYSTMTNISNRVSGNMVAGSISSALTNFIPITQSWGQVSPVYSLRAMVDTVRSAVRDDGTVDKSDFLTNRLRGEENLHKGAWDKVSDGLSVMFDGIDSFTSQTVWRSKYLQNMKNGMSEAEAIKNADQFAENVIAGRSRGNMPTAFDAKNPLVKAFTAFQLEVNNQYGYMFKDMPQDVTAETKAGKIAKLTAGYVTMFIGAYAYNALYSALTGRDAAFDPIGIFQELLGDIFGSDDEEEKEPADIILDFSEDVIEELPFVGGLFGGGRIPISSALPYGDISETYTGTLEDIGDEDWAGLTKEWLNPLVYLVSPMAGSQIKKTVQGLSMFFGDKPVSGSYTDKGALRFPVAATPGNVIQSALFGQWSGENAREYFDQGRNPLNEKQTDEFIDSGMSIKDYWKFQDEMSELKDKVESGTATYEEILTYMNMSSVRNEVSKLYGLRDDVLDSNVLSDKKKQETVDDIRDDIRALNEKGFESFGDVEIDGIYATVGNDHYRLYTPDRGDDFDDPYGLGVNIYQNDAPYWRKLSEDELERQTEVVDGLGITPEEYWGERHEEYNFAYDSPERYQVARAVGGYDAYRVYAQELYCLKADRDEDGKVISGSRKQKVIDYINSLDASFEEKIILFRSQYTTDNTYNYEIIDYLNGRQDISADEMRVILLELGFMVDGEGYITWN